MDLAFNVSADQEKRENAVITLLRLTRWRSDAYEIFIKEVGKDDEVICSAIRIVAELCKNNVSRTNCKSTMINVVLPWCLNIMNSKSTERVNASQYCLQIILNTYSGMNDEPDSKPDEVLCEMHEEVIDKYLSSLLDKIVNKTTTGIARDALIKFITRNIHYTALNWAKQLIEFGGLRRLMEVASQCQSEYCNSLDITSSTQTITSVCLTKIDENLDENDKKGFFNIINKFIREDLNSTNVECHVNAIVAMITLTFGPFNVANTIITTDGFDMIIVNFWNENDLLLQKVICEFIYVVVTKYDEFIMFIRESLPILEKLCYSEDPSNLENLTSFKSIQVRAFVNICKMSKFEEIKYFPAAYMFVDDEVRIFVWLEICGQFLISPQRDMRKWAVAGLSYLTFNPVVKNTLIEDRQAVEAIIEFAKTENQSILYQVDILLVNLCSAYDKEDLIIEKKTFVDRFYLKELIQVADNNVRERQRVLAHAGMTSALVSLAKTGSENSKELIARVFHAICSRQELRKIVIQEGGTEALLLLALNGTDKGKIDATRALVYLALTTSPEVAFPGQIIMEVVQPISHLLNPERSINERCDALTALCNLASVNNSIREHIFKTKYEKIERCMRDNDNQLKRTSIQLTNNLVSCRKVAFQLVEQRSDQLRESMMSSMVDDTNENIIYTKKELAGMFVTLTAASEEACKKLIGWDFWLTYLRFLLNDRYNDLQHKGTEITLNMMKSTKDVAVKLMKMDTIMEQVKALSKNDTMQNKEIKKLASLVLEAVAEWDNIEGNVEGNKSSDSTDNTD
ncbi:protein unc-45 homolog B-like [Temnothorax longispinosus]|uniref:protein unc-45 homolog B-like n=1 Tax=Temnothorax longispinosus TaxID=300112 RepID=UPI003A9A2A3C